MSVHGTQRDSKLDVYARPYIPQDFLKANAAPAIDILCLPARTLDLSKYVQSFVAKDFESAVFQYKTEANLSRPITPSSELSQSTFEKFFLAALAQERTALQTECDEHAIYNIPLPPSPGNSGDQTYMLEVPGLRESTLRVEINDVVLVRPLLFNSNGDVLLNSNTYDNYGQPIAPLHPLYTQFHARIWNIDRRAETLRLRIDHLPWGSFRFNISFNPQWSRSHAMREAVSDAHGQLSTGNDWVETMLFPEPGDGHKQTSLNERIHLLDYNGRQLNHEQTKAIYTVQDGQYGTVPYLISGPPGTGKTTTVIAMALQMIKDPKARLLLCAPSDQASDTLVQRLSRALTPKYLLRLNAATRSFPEVPQNVLSFCHVQDTIFSPPPFKELMQKRIVVVTCRDAEILLKAAVTNRDLLAVGRKMQEDFYPETAEDEFNVVLHWSSVIIDEAAQAMEPEALLPLMVVAPPTNYKGFGLKMPSVVMVGDANQLGPRTASREPTLQRSLFERLFDRSLYREHPLARSKQTGGTIRPLTQDMLPIYRPPFTDLVRNYRSHPAILAIPSSLFYNDTLEPTVRAQNPVLRWSGFRGSGLPVLFSDNRSRDEIERDGGGWYNVGEADVALAYARSLVREGLLLPPDICIMSPFRAQVKVLRAMARDKHYNLAGVNIGPLEAFQGLEARFVIICTTRTRDRFIDQDIARGLGVIHEARRFNVALTRAKEGMVVIGNPQVLVGDENWASFIAFCRRMGCWDGKQEADWQMPHSSKIKTSRLERQMQWKSKMDSRKLETSDLHRRMGRLHFGMSEEEAFYEAGIAAEEALGKHVVGADDHAQESELDSEHQCE